MREDSIKNDLRENLQKFILEHQKINIKEPFIVRVYIKEDLFYDYLLTKNGVISIEKNTEKFLDDYPLVQIDYKVLKKILEEPFRALRYLLQGKIRIKGNLALP